MISAMCPNVLSRNIRNERLETIGFSVEDQAVFTTMRRATKPFCTNEESEFQRHIEARQLRAGIEFGAREVVDAETTLTYEIAYLVDPNLAAVVHFESTSWYESAVHNGEHGCVEKRSISVVEGTINEDVSCGLASRPRLTCSPPPLPGAAHALPSLTP